MNRRTSTDTALSDSGKCSASSEPTINTRQTFPPLPILVVLNCQCAMSVVSVDGHSEAHLSCDVDGLEWGLGICILNKHSMN